MQHCATKPVANRGLSQEALPLGAFLRLGPQIPVCSRDSDGQVSHQGAQKPSQGPHSHSHEVLPRVLPRRAVFWVVHATRRAWASWATSQQRPGNATWLSCRWTHCPGAEATAPAAVHRLKGSCGRCCCLRLQVGAARLRRPDYPIPLPAELRGNETTAPGAPQWAERGTGILW